MIINYCNEKLQQVFIELTLNSEQDEYIREVGNRQYVITGADVFLHFNRVLSGMPLNILIMK